MEKKILLKNLTEKMDKVLLNLEHDFNGLRTGRASADFLAPVLVESYGNKVPINQISTISTPDAKTITIQVWDNSLIKTVEKAIVDANLGLNPVADRTIAFSTVFITELSHSLDSNCFSIRRLEISRKLALNMALYYQV